MAPDLKSATLSAARVLLRPIVRLLLKTGIPWREFADVAKTTYVEVASDEFGIRGRPTNVARVAILTGINRREVARQRELLAQTILPEPTYLNAAQRVLSGWHQDPEFTDASAAPRDLPVEGPAPSFAALSERYGGDVPATALLKELRNVGSVIAVEGERVRAVSRVYIPLQIDAAKVLRAGSVLADLGETVVHDLICLDAAELRFERRAENDSIEARHLPAFRALLEREGQAFLERIDDWLTAHESRADSTQQRPRLRLGVGVYHLQTEMKRGPKS